jgi:hypothetical protein
VPFVSSGLRRSFVFGCGPQCFQGYRFLLDPTVDLKHLSKLFLIPASGRNCGFLFIDRNTRKFVSILEVNKKEKVGLQSIGKALRTVPHGSFEDYVA